MSQLEIAADEQNEKNPSSWLDYTFLIFRQRMLAKKKPSENETVRANEKVAEQRVSFATSIYPVPFEIEPSYNNENLIHKWN